jgi:hypothetical protein
MVGGPGSGAQVPTKPSGAQNARDLNRQPTNSLTFDASSHRPHLGSGTEGFQFLTLVPRETLWGLIRIHTAEPGMGCAIASPEDQPTIRNQQQCQTPL